MQLGAMPGKDRPEMAMEHAGMTGEGQVCVSEIARRLEIAGFEVERAEYEGLSFVSVQEYFGNPVAIYEDGIVVVETRRFPWTFLFSATNQATDGLVAQGMRKHGKEHGEEFGCVGYGMNADFIEDSAELWETVVEEHRRAAGKNLTPGAVVQRVLSMVDEFQTGRAYDA
jgi:hypothetical protein